MPIRSIQNRKIYIQKVSKIERDIEGAQVKISLAFECQIFQNSDKQVGQETVSSSLSLAFPITI